MVFSSNIFLFLFLPLTLLAYFLPLGKRYKNTLLLVASLLFYSWGEAQYLVLLVVSIIGNYLFGIGIEKGRRVIFWALAFNLLLLGYFKYANFLIENLNYLLPYKISFNEVHLPIGISFFTFHAISYLVDIYRKKCHAQRDIFALALYISFFPQLVAGPIVRYNVIEKYLIKRRQSWVFTAYGVRRFIIGLGKKVLIANPLGEVADAVFALSGGDISTSTAWIGIICYTLQIYFDFSGYSDMASGLARIFGFRFPPNFNYPYISRSIREFWRRWHISLSTWFRDYVYIPLGGNRVSTGRQYFNLVLVFFLCGLWHGSSWNFVVWGLFHGVFLVLERVFEGKIKVPFFIHNFYTMLIIMIGWVFFRSPDLAFSFTYLERMFFFNDVEESIYVSRLITSHITWTCLALALIGISPFMRDSLVKLMRQNKSLVTVFDVYLLIIFSVSVIRLSAATHNPFIYFQF